MRITKCGAIWMYNQQRYNLSFHKKSLKLAIHYLPEILTLPWVVCAFVN